MKYVLALIVGGMLPLGVRAVTIDMVTVGNPGNPGEVNGAGIYGAVSSTYLMGKTEVTNAQYVAFLNAKAASDPYGLYSTSMALFSQGGIVRSGVSGSYTYAVKPDEDNVEPDFITYSYANKPVVYVSWFDAIRFANWMHNGQGSGDTETGAYTIIGGATPTNPDSIVRNAGAKWFLPTENQWYKAAYYSGSGNTYFDYPTATDSVPNNNQPDSDTGNSANFLNGSLVTTGNSSYPHTAVGAYSLSDSVYGTFDQGGNVAEWTETLGGTNRRVRRGGSWQQDASYMSSAVRETPVNTSEMASLGFRLAALFVAAVPGDYNGNGVVDGADYVVWRKHLGETYQLQNEVAGTSPGTVTSADYTAWRERFGNTSGTGAGESLSLGAVPEPGCMFLSLGGMTLAASGVRRRRRK